MLKHFIRDDSVELERLKNNFSDRALEYVLELVRIPYLTSCWISDLSHIYIACDTSDP